MNILTTLTNTRNETEKYFDLSEEELVKTYGEGKWTVKQILVHLADADSVLLDRIKRVISSQQSLPLGDFARLLMPNYLLYLKDYISKSHASKNQTKRNTCTLLRNFHLLSVDTAFRNH